MISSHTTPGFLRTGASRVHSYLLGYRSIEHIVGHSTRSPSTRTI
jgi:hypothetical protein